MAKAEIKYVFAKNLEEYARLIETLEQKDYLWSNQNTLVNEYLQHYKASGTLLKVKSENRTLSVVPVTDINKLKHPITSTEDYLMELKKEQVNHHEDETEKERIEEVQNESQKEIELEY